MRARAKNSRKNSRLLLILLVIMSIINVSRSMISKIKAS